MPHEDDLLRDGLPLPAGAPTEGAAVDPEGAPSGLRRPAKIGLWHGARVPGETGVEAAEGCLAFSVFEIPAAPDFSSPRFPDLAQLDKSQRVARVGQRQLQFLDALHNLGPLSAVTLRYYYERPARGEGRVRLFLIGRSFGRSEAEATNGTRRFRETVRRSFPAEYRLVDLRPEGRDAEVARRVLALDGVRSIAEILKPEQTLPAWHDPSVCGFSFYYFPKPFEPAENDMIETCRALTRDEAGRPAVLDLCLVPAGAGYAAGPLTETERALLGKWLNVCDAWGRDQRRQLPGGLYSQPVSVEIEADPRAGDARKAYAELLQRYGGAQSRSFLYSFRALWWEDEPPLGIAAALASFATAPGSALQPHAVPAHHPAFQRALNAARYCYVTPAVCREEIWQHPEAPETLRRLHRLIDLKEAASFFRLPIPGRDGCPGLRLDTGFAPAAPTEDKLARGGVVRIGHYVEGGRRTEEEAAFAAADLAKHCLIVGTPGSGKTTLCFSLLRQLWEEHGVPFLVLEPAKNEYRALKELPCFRDEMLVFTVGGETISPFRLNPFEILDGVSVSEHISALSRCFSGAFSLWDPLPMILDQAVREIYADKGWYESDTGGEDPALAPPTMEDLLHKALAVAQGKSYRGEFAGNLRGALETRIGSLTRGLKGNCFNTRRSVPIASLMERPVVLELDALEGDEKALTMLFVLTLVREYAKAHARARRLAGRKLSHVVLVEEAHNVIGRGEARGGGEKANPKEAAISYFTNMLAEVRAYGEGIMIADQLPSALAPEAVKTTNIKVMHRLVGADDRSEMGNSMAFDAGQFQQAATLPAGHSFVYMEGESRSRLVVEPDFKRHCEEQGFQVDIPPDDATLRDWMRDFRAREEVRDAFLPHRGCRDVCRVCDARVRQESERIVEREWTRIERLTRRLAESAEGPRDPYPVICDALGLPAADAVRRGCLRVHVWRQVAKLASPAPRPKAD